MRVLRVMICLSVLLLALLVSVVLAPVARSQEAKSKPDSVRVATPQKTIEITSDIRGSDWRPTISADDIKRSTIRVNGKWCRSFWVEACRYEDKVTMDKGTNRSARDKDGKK